MVKLTVRLGEPLLRLSANPSFSLQNPVLLACPVNIGGLQPCLTPQKIIMKLQKRRVTHKLQVLSFYSRTLKRSALSFL
jgi:hypothetical protein